MSTRGPKPSEAERPLLDRAAPCFADVATIAALGLEREFARQGRRLDLVIVVLERHHHKDLLPLPAL